MLSWRQELFKAQQNCVPPPIKRNFCAPWIWHKCSLWRSFQNKSMFFQMKVIKKVFWLQFKKYVIHCSVLVSMRDRSHFQSHLPPRSKTKDLQKLKWHINPDREVCLVKNISKHFLIATEKKVFKKRGLVVTIIENNTFFDIFGMILSSSVQISVYTPFPG